MVSDTFAYWAARMLVIPGTSVPWTSYKLAPLSVEELPKDASYDPSWEALPPKTIGSWSIQEYVAQDKEAEPPVAEVLPYAYLETPPSAWVNDESVDVEIYILAVIGYNAENQEWELLFWEPLDTMETVAPGETFKVTEVTFKLMELQDV